MKNRNAGKKIIVALFLILLIVAIIACGIYVYLATDLFKTPEQLFKKYMLSNIIQIGQSNFEPFNEIEERSENELTEYNLNLNIDASSLNIDDAEKIDVNLSLKTDWPNKNEELEILANKDETEYFKGYIALTNETFGISVPDLYDKYVAIENRDFKKMAKTIEIPEEYIKMIPDKIPSSLTPEDEEKINQLANKYFTKIVDQFGENSYIAEKDINITVNSKEVITDKYTLSISSKAIYESVTTAITELLEDPEFTTLCQDRVTTEQLEELKTSYKEFLTQNPVSDIEEKKVNISVYAAEGKTVKTELKVDENEAYFAIDNNENESIIIFEVIEPKDEYISVGTTTTTTIKNTYTNNAGELIYETVTAYNKDDIATLQAEYDAEFADYGSDFEKNYSELYSDEKMKYVIQTKKTNDNTITGTVSFDGEELESLKEIVDISFKCQFGNASVTTLSKDNTVVINDYTMDDYGKLIEEIGTNIITLSIKKPDSLIGTIIAGNMLDNSTSEDSYYSDNNTSDDNLEDSSGTYENITLPDSSDNDNYLYPTITDNAEILREEIDSVITAGLEMSLNRYKNELIFNPEANLGDFLTLESVQEYCGSEYTLELPDSTTIRCAINRDGIDYIYYALMNINGADFTVTEVEVLTEEEYLNR